MSAIIPSPAIKIAFSMFPMPKYLKTVNNNKHVATINPLLELAKSIENKKKKKANKFMKNKNINVGDLGSVK